MGYQATAAPTKLATTLTINRASTPRAEQAITKHQQAAKNPQLLTKHAANPTHQPMSTTHLPITLKAETLLKNSKTTAFAAMNSYHHCVAILTQQTTPKSNSTTSTAQSLTSTAQQLTKKLTNHSPSSTKAHFTT
jgi:hypothetical protein